MELETAVVSRSVGYLFTSVAGVKEEEEETGTGHGGGGR